MDDKNIVALLWQRSEQALQLLAKRFGALLYRLAMNILGDRQDAEETVSDTYLALWNTIPPEKPDPLTAYVCRVGRNSALKKLRDNIVDRPFVFVIANHYGVPLFAGIVNEP